MKIALGFLLAFLVLVVCDAGDFPTGPAERGVRLSADCPPAVGDSFPIPIMDGDGLYGGGSNVPPTSHRDAGLLAASQVPESGAVLLAVGMSITRGAFLAWQETAVTDAIMVNGACGGCVAPRWTTSDGKGWSKVRYELGLKGLTGADVDVVWLSVTNGENASATQEDLEAILALMRTELPNVKQVFISNRTYAGYSTKGLEPGAWGDGVAAKQFVLNHLNETGPWIGWAADLWANGETPRSDGLQWFVSDFRDDGLHYTLQGRAKTGALVEAFFETSPFAGWYQP